MLRFLAVCGAGAVGCGSRYLLGLAFATKTSFPYATLIVNLVGSFAIALIMEYALRHAALSTTLRIALTTGLLGGLTTYSAFNYESTQLVLNGNVVRGIANVLVTVVGCFLAGVFGLWLARKLG